MQKLTYFGQTNYRNTQQRFGIKQHDRLLHTYVIGKTGSGKSTLIHTKIMQDIYNGRGCCILDPHGDLALKIYEDIPDHSKNKVIYFDLTDGSIPFRYNPLKRVQYEKRSLVAASILEALQKLWHDAWGVKLEHILRNVLLTLLDQPEATFGDIPLLLLDKSFRSGCLKHIRSTEVRNFWDKEYVRYNQNDILPVLNKVSAFLVHPILKKVLVENNEELSLRRIMDEGTTLIVNLSKGHIGQEVAHVLGALLVTSIGSAAFSRVDTPEDDRVPFFVYIDEFHNFTTLSFVNMLSELRKYKIGLVLVNQYLQQLEKDIRHAVIGNVGSIISFRLGTDDARVFAQEMFPIFKPEDFINLPNYHIYLKLMIDGSPSKPFSAQTITFSSLLTLFSG